METRNCKNCQKDFTIESEDFNFYKKIDVPAPTWCPDCRLQRRLAWMIDLSLYKRKCGLCGEERICKYEPSAPFVVYCHECWWSEKWDSSNFTKELDFSKPFLEQFNELFHKTPILGLSIDSITGKLSPYTNHVGNSKNSYMIFYSNYTENSLFGYYLVNTKMTLNSSMVMQSELSFDDKNCFKNYNTIGTLDTNESFDSIFLRDSVNCNNCFGSANLRNSKYVFFNEQLTKEGYAEKMKDIDLGSYKQYISWQEKAQEHFKNYPPNPVYLNNNVNSEGNYLFDSKNCKECYETIKAEDSKYLMLIKEGPVKDSYDYTDWGENASLVYDSIVVGENVSNIKFCWYVYLNSSNMQYSALCIGCKDCFGCVGLKKKQYCILNKQYTKEEYEALVPKIIAHMNEMPFKDKKGLLYKYGEFFPMEFSSYKYNNSFANFFFPMDKGSILNRGLGYYEPNVKEYPITIPAQDLPDNIKDTDESILREIIGCSTCERGYKVAEQELQISKRMNVALSRQCPFCRIGGKVKKWVTQMNQLARQCDKCGTAFKTHYTTEEAPKIYCKDCYLQEVY